MFVPPALFSVSLFSKTRPGVDPYLKDFLLRTHSQKSLSHAHWAKSSYLYLSWRSVNWKWKILNENNRISTVLYFVPMCNSISKNWTCLFSDEDSWIVKRETEINFLLSLPALWFLDLGYLEIGQKGSVFLCLMPPQQPWPIRVWTWDIWGWPTWIISI